MPEFVGDKQVSLLIYQYLTPINDHTRRSETFSVSSKFLRWNFTLILNTEMILSRLHILFRSILFHSHDGYGVIKGSLLHRFLSQTTPKAAGTPDWNRGIATKTLFLPFSKTF